MSDPIASLPLEAFTAGLRTKMFSDQEIAGWIRSNPVGGSQKVALLQAITELKAGGPITGIVRTALREMEGLPPVEGDDV
jgi:hypothetical protein